MGGWPHRRELGSRRRIFRDEPAVVDCVVERHLEHRMRPPDSPRAKSRRRHLIHPPLNGLVVDLRDRPVAEPRLDPQSPVVLVSAADFGAEVGARSDPGSVYRLEFGSAAPWVQGLARGAARDKPGFELLGGALGAECLLALRPVRKSPLDVIADTGFGLSSPNRHGRLPSQLMFRARLEPYRFWRSMFGSDAEAIATVRQDRHQIRADSIHWSTSFRAQRRCLIAQPDVVWAWSRHSALSLGCPVVERGDRHTGDVMDFFGREHLTTVGQGFRHWDSLRLEEMGPKRPLVVGWNDTTVSSYPHPAVHNFRPRHQPAGRCGMAPTW